MNWAIIVAFLGVFVGVLLGILAIITGLMQIHSYIDTYVKTFLKRSPFQLTFIVMILAIVVSLVLTPVVMQISKIGEGGKDNSSLTATSASPTSATPTPFTQSGPIDLTPNSIIYYGTIYSWSRPSTSDHCEPQLPTCDPASVRVLLLKEKAIVTATCWIYGQRVITGTLNDPGYVDNRWVRIKGGTYLANTWFVRTKLDTDHLPSCGHI